MNTVAPQVSGTTLLQPYPQWARIQFRDRPWDHEGAIQDLCLIPGVAWRDRNNALDLSRWTWDLNPVINLIEKLGLKQPEKRYFKPPNFGWIPKRRPFEHQVDGAKFLLEAGGGIIGDEMGLGKTLAAIYAAETYARHRNPNKPRLVIAPSFMREAWRNELFAAGVIEDPEHFVILKGRDFMKKGQSGWKDPRTDQTARWFFCHYEILSAWAGKLHQGQFLSAIIDEIHYCKNPSSGRSKALLAAVGPIPFRVGLTGTLLINKPSDMWMPLSATCGEWTWGSYSTFRVAHSGALTSHGHLVDVTPTRVDELEKRLKSVYIRRTFADAGIKLPEFSRSQISVDIHEKLLVEHDRHIKKIPLDRVMQALMTGRFYGDNVLPLLIQARQVTSRAKMATTLESILNATEQGANCVVFVFERETAEKFVGMLQQDFEKHSVDARFIHGGLDIKERAESVDWFQDEGKNAGTFPKVLCATYGALGVGVTLTKARYVFLHDLPWTMAEVLQAEKRVHRIGSKLPVVSQWVIATDTIDMWIGKILQQKAKLSKEILKDSSGTDALEETQMSEPGDFENSVIIEKQLTEWLLSRRSK